MHTADYLDWLEQFLGPNFPWFVNRLCGDDRLATGATTGRVFPTPDLIIVFHSCYIHIHSCRYEPVTAKAIRALWQAKRAGNSNRDRAKRGRMC